MTAAIVPAAVRRTVATVENDELHPRSNAMYSLHEALARERMREYQQRSSEGRLAHRASAERRYHRAEARRQRRAAR